MKVVETTKVERHAQYLVFWCPGCDCLHPIYHKREDHTGPVWSWNGSFESPTFQPSLLLNGTEMTAAGKKDYEEWCAAEYPERNGKPFDSKPTVCHSFIRDGNIQFLTDCTHALKGQTVPLPEEPLEQKRKEIPA